MAKAVESPAALRRRITITSSLAVANTGGNSTAATAAGSASGSAAAAQANCGIYRRACAARMLPEQIGESKEIYSYYE